MDDSTLHEGESTHTGQLAGTTRPKEKQLATTGEATRGREADDSLRPVVRAGVDSPARVGLRHYRVPSHFLRDPFLL